MSNIVFANCTFKTFILELYLNKIIRKSVAILGSKIDKKVFNAAKKFVIKT